MAEDEAATKDEAGTEDEAATKAQESEQEQEEAKKEMERLEEGDPPEKLEDWPDGKAKYETFGGPEGDHSYEDGPEAKLGESGVRHHEDGSVSIDGEEVDNPDEYKGEPVPGGTTDPEAPENRADGDSDAGDGGDDES